MGTLHSAASIRKIAADAGGPPTGDSPAKTLAAATAARITEHIVDKVKADPKLLSLVIPASMLGETMAQRTQTRLALENQNFSVIRNSGDDNADYTISWAS